MRSLPSQSRCPMDTPWIATSAWRGTCERAENSRRQLLSYSACVNTSSYDMPAVCKVLVRRMVRNHELHKHVNAVMHDFLELLACSQLARYNTAADEDSPVLAMAPVGGALVAAWLCVHPLWVLQVREDSNRRSEHSQQSLHW